MASSSRHIKLATRLPDRLQRFFARFPPQQLIESTSTSTNTSESHVPAFGSAAVDSSAIQSSKDSLTASSDFQIPSSPFRAWRHPVTSRWQDPVYSLRRQAELVKLARQHGVEELLPTSVKGTMERLKRREENGLRVKGTGVGQKVKGKEWERTLKGRLDKRREAMLGMPQLVQTWKERGHGRGNKKWPK